MKYDGNTPSNWGVGPWVPPAIRHQITKAKIRELRDIAQALIDARCDKTLDDFDTFNGKGITDAQRRQLKQRGY